MYKYVLNSVVKIPLMFAKFFEYYAIILGGAFFRGHAVIILQSVMKNLSNCGKTLFIQLSMVH